MKRRKYTPREYYVKKEDSPNPRAEKPDSTEAKIFSYQNQPNRRGNHHRDNHFSHFNNTPQQNAQIRPESGLIDKQNPKFSRPYFRRGRRANYDQNRSHQFPANQRANQADEDVFEDACLVCLEQIPTRSKIWVCRQCSVVTHLSCIRQWLEKLRSRQSANPTDIYSDSDALNFACPHCNYIYVKEEPRHTCFCGKETNPVFSSFHEPNSCGKPCERQRDHLCGHHCPKRCHYGRCPPCTRKRVFACYCEQSNIEINCAELGALNSLSCGEPCEKPLGCGRHICKEICHDGRCSPCALSSLTSCLCGAESKLLGCGETFSCAKICGRMLDCGKHFCSKSCHLPGQCEPCESKVMPQERCACGAETIESLLGRPRQTCLEPKPTCQRTCGRVLACGHQCVLACHESPCDCGKRIKKDCRCGLLALEILCCEQNEPLICKTICGKKKSCLKHACEILCCAFKSAKKDLPVHDCKKICGEPLNCKLHDCTRKCHKGPCPPCDAFLSRPLYCACQSQVILPPVLCGTEAPKCNRRCNKALACGHSCYFDCHFGDCPDCEEIVDKNCACGGAVIKNVKCSKMPMCGKLCDNPFFCGHKCRQMCHEKSQCDFLRKIRREKFEADNSIPKEEKEFFSQGDLLDKSCFARCDKRKKSCRHPCRTFCHPGFDCPPLHCLSMVKVYCQCKNRMEFRECGQLGEGPSRQLVLECDNKCKNLQRFKALYQAEEELNKLYYSQSLVSFAQANADFVRKVEQTLREMYFNAEEKTEFSLDKHSEEKAHFLIRLLGRHYGLEASYLKVSKGFAVDVYKTEEFLLPKVSLSEYVDMLNKNQISGKILPFEVVIKFFNLTIFDKTDFLDQIFQADKTKYYIEKFNNVVYMYIWKASDLEHFSAILKEQKNNWSTFVVEFSRKKGDDNDLGSPNKNEKEADKKGHHDLLAEGDTVNYKMEPDVLPVSKKGKIKKEKESNIFEQFAK